jgi:selenocysteine-specific elongation factor
MDLFRLPVDRALSLAGVGTVVTGTAWSGRLKLGDAVRLLPGGAEGRVRSLERHAEPVSETVPGERVAAGLAGVEREQVRRGQVLVLRADPWIPTRAIDVSIELLSGLRRPLAHHSRVRLHLGTAEVLARVHTAVPIPPGGSGLARLALESPIVARGADRFVLRSYSPVETIGGGWVVDPAPSPGRPIWPEGISSADPGSRLGALATRRRTGLEVTGIPLALGTPPDATPVLLSRSSLQQSEGFLVPPESVARVKATGVALVERYHQAHPAEPGMPLETLRQQLARQGRAAFLALEQLTRDGTLILAGGSVRSGTFLPRQLETGQAARVLALVEQGGLAPPNVAELESQLKLQGVGEILRQLAQKGQVEAVERDRFFSSVALAGFSEVVARVGGNGPITPQTLREATGLSRKFLIPLLEWSDRTGLTIRSGDIRRLVPPRGTPVGEA